MPAYCTQEQIEAYYGRESVRQWADLNNSKLSDEIAARVALAIAAASEDIDDRLRGGPYRLPFAAATDEPPTPGAINRICIWLAGHDLYNARGAQDFDEEGRPIHRLSGDRRRAWAALRELHAGIVRLDAALASSRDAPAVIAEPRPPAIGDDERDNWT